MVDPDYLAPKLGITPEDLRAGLQRGDIARVTETGEGADSGMTRVILRTSTRAWAAEVDANGAAREIPPPRVVEAAFAKEKDLSDRVRAHLECLAEKEVPITLGELASALGLWTPGSVDKVTQALETTMREGRCRRTALHSRPCRFPRTRQSARQGLFRSRPRTLARPAERRKRGGLSRPRAPLPERVHGQVKISGAILS